MRHVKLIAWAAGTLLAAYAHAQWDLGESHTTADLRGVASVGGGGGVAWASGTRGTVLRTEDGGFVWQGCAVPAGAAELDFRGVQAFDEQSAIVMSSGPGDRSRLYRTDDGCLTWRLLKTNTDPQGFWDAVRFTDREHGMVLGDPVDGHFVLLRTADGGKSWQQVTLQPVASAEHQGAFAASNSALLLSPAGDWSFCTGGTAGPHVWHGATELAAAAAPRGAAPLATTASVEELLSATRAETAGCFSLAQRGGAGGPVVAVGGDYKQPEAAEGTAWASAAAAAEGGGHGGFRFGAAAAGPGGYRSSVDWNGAINAWVAVGPTGTDVSTDDGVHWRPLRGASAGDWNAVSGPFAVGPAGRVGRLRTDVLTRSDTSPAAK